MAESTCQGCTLTFTSLTAFDAHQRTTDVPPNVVCLDPRTLKHPLVARVRGRAGRRRTVWGLPGGRDYFGGDAA